MIIERTDDFIFTAKMTTDEVNLVADMLLLQVINKGPEIINGINTEHLLKTVSDALADPE